MLRENAMLLMVVPEEEQGMILLESDDTSGVIGEFDFIPHEYKATMKIALYPIEDYVSDLMLLPGYKVSDKTLDVYRQDGVTHIALLSLEHKSEKKMMFGATEFTLGFVVYYLAASNKYCLLHCQQCAQCAAGWLADMQKEWELNAGRGLQKARSSYH